MIKKAVGFVHEGGLLEIIRLAYLAGVCDSECGTGRWCSQGSTEKAEELLEEFIDEGLCYED